MQHWSLRTVSGNAERNSDHRTEIAPLKKIRRRTRRKHIFWELGGK